MILTGWREQYNRMRRSLERLQRIANGTDDTSADGARDALIHFYQDAYHLKDWLKNDGTVAIGGVEQAVNNDTTLQLAADLANGTKHLRLTDTRTGDLKTAFTSQSVTVRPGTVGSGAPGRPPMYDWTVESGGHAHDAVALAADVAAAWETWLRAKGLL